MLTESSVELKNSLASQALPFKGPQGVCLYSVCPREIPTCLSPNAIVTTVRVPYAESGLFWDVV